MHRPAVGVRGAETLAVCVGDGRSETPILPPESIAGTLPACTAPSSTPAGATIVDAADFPSAKQRFTQ